LNTRPSIAQPPVAPVQDTSSKQQQQKNTNPIISIQDCHLTQPCTSEKNKQIKTQNKSHPIQSLNKPLSKKKRCPVRMAAIQKSTNKFIKMLERVWRKGNPLTLLVGMQTSTATLYNRLQFHPPH